MFEYSGEPEDIMHFCNKDLPSSELVKAVKKLIGEPHEKVLTVDLAPFYFNNPAPEVSHFESLLISYHHFHIFSFTGLCIIRKTLNGGKPSLRLPLLLKMVRLTTMKKKKKR